MKHEEIIKKLTLEEKCYILSGRDFWSTYSYEKKGVPSINLSDGPHGIRKQEGGRRSAGTERIGACHLFPDGGDHCQQLGS